ncbi:30S ribosomal protein S16 [Nonomuraea rhizosphaerae]|uniref:30S ribosomal protein S16 n=1 Tax=Nonomuraea rhizosphaerae TaxID=2665663 RepID=UPI001C5DB2CF|nr:30S ribosomal protein S16 [Nonomuraea rhizosphaerae]
MAVKIKLKRLGMIRNAQYRIVIADSRTKRDGRAIEEIGLYHPKEDPSRIEVNAERAAYWLGVGAQPTEPVLKLLKLTGDWQKFKGEPAPAPLKVAEPAADRHALYEAAAKETLSGGDTGTAATTPRKARKKDEAEAAPAAEAKTEAKPEAKAEAAPETKTEGEA